MAWLAGNSKFGCTQKTDDSLPSVTRIESDDESFGNTNNDDLDLAVISCIRDRRSIFPNGFKKNPPPLNKDVIQSLLNAALYGPFHGKCYAENQHPAKFVVLGKKSMVEMQNLTLEYYDKYWEDHWSSIDEYQKFRACTHAEITGRWGPVNYMIGIVMRRQAGTKRFPVWEEAAAVACAVQNMHIQSTKFKHLACYWSSWHAGARDSGMMKAFLDMEEEDVCMGFFIVAQAKNPQFRPRRERNSSLMKVEWRT
jgi:nitroreductase